eukprot:gb/GECG01003075.1/.p1 GENE.gb/GECG01003075.1/~~gb/GECG01003075.1/.p1  ORF type:complete len:577 (+),score=47.85 gb/GECG01003075.1/:1-1731(+)
MPTLPKIWKRCFKGDGQTRVYPETLGYEEDHPAPVLSHVHQTTRGAECVTEYVSNSAAAAMPRTRPLRNGWCVEARNNESEAAFAEGVDTVPQRSTAAAAGDGVPTHSTCIPSAQPSRISTDAVSDIYLETPTVRAITPQEESSTSSCNIHVSSDNYVPEYRRIIPSFLEGRLGNVLSPCLRETDIEYRKLVKEHCGLPAYLGIVLFDRAIQACSLLAELVAEGTLGRVCSISPVAGSAGGTPVKEEKALSLIDLLRFWPPGLEKAGRKSKILHLMGPPTKEFVLNMEQSTTAAEIQTTISRKFERHRHLNGHDIRPLVEALVQRHPDLQSVKKDASLRSCYVTSVLTRLFASLRSLACWRISYGNLWDSNVSDVFYRCASCGIEEVEIFSLRGFVNYHAIFTHALKRSSSEEYGSELPHTYPPARIQDREISPVVLMSLLKLNIPEFFCRRLASTRFRWKSRAGSEGKLNFEDFMWFCLALEDRMSDISILYWFAIYDSDDDGYLSLDDLNCFVKEVEATCTSERARHIRDGLWRLLCAIESDPRYGIKLSPGGILRRGLGPLLLQFLVPKRKTS